MLHNERRKNLKFYIFRIVRSRTRLIKENFLDIQNKQKNWGKILGVCNTYQNRF